MKFHKIACQNCKHRFRKKIDWRQSKKIKKIKCPKCKKPFQGERETFWEEDFWERSGQANQTCQKNKKEKNMKFDEKENGEENSEEKEEEKEEEVVAI